MPVTFAVLHVLAHHRWWALKQMGMAARTLRRVPGLRFFRWMGVGQGRVFSLLPDFSRYAFLGVWNSGEDAVRFWTTSPFWKDVTDRCAKIDLFSLTPVSSRGSWDGVNPFVPEAGEQEGVPLAVLTRASVRLPALPAFWQNARQAADHLDQAEGLLYSVGMGELPYVRQATFSVWTDAASMKNYVYRDAGRRDAGRRGAGHRGEGHRSVIRRKEAGKWYAEELFARFQLGR